MSDALANLMNRSSPEAFFGIVISVGGAFLVAIIGIIVGCWSQVRTAGDGYLAQARNAGPRHVGRRN